MSAAPPAAGPAAGAAPELPRSARQRRGPGPSRSVPVPFAWRQSCLGSLCCGSRRRQAARWPAAAEHAAGVGRLPLASLADPFREPSASPWPSVGWPLIGGYRQAPGRTARAARRGSRTVRPSADLRAGQEAWRPAGPRAAMAHATRPTPRPGCLPTPSARAQRRGLPVALGPCDFRLGQGQAAPAKGYRGRSPSADLPARETLDDAVPGWRPGALVQVCGFRLLSSDRPAGGVMHDPGPDRDVPPRRGQRSPEDGRRASRWKAPCWEASWPCPTSAPLTRYGRPHRSQTRTWAAGQARPGRPRLRAAPPSSAGDAD